MKFIDLFAGLGGFHLAAQSLGGDCVFASEITPYLQDIYKKNFHSDIEGDIQKIPLENIPEHDLLCAGFPCQPFSKAGQQLGWKDAVRGTVFFKVIEILEYHKPELIILENVAHFVNHDKGNTYQRVLNALAVLGYDIQSKKLSPHQFGIPQIRERMYLVARREDVGGLNDFKWPENVVDELDINSVLDENPQDARSLPSHVIDCLNVWQKFLDAFPQNAKLPSFPIWTDEFGADYPYDKDSLYKLKMENLRSYRGSYGESLVGNKKSELLQGVPSYSRSKKGTFPIWKQRFIQQNRDLYSQNEKWLDEWLPAIRRFPHSLRKFEWNCQGEERNLWKYIIQFRASGVRVKRRTTSPSLIAMNTTQVPIIAWQKRYMTIRECARLQSMDSLTYLPEIDTNAFKALGNAINVEVARKVLKNLLACRTSTEVHGKQEIYAVYV